jgi:hypothetical protein
MIQLPQRFHGAHLEKTDLAMCELSYSYLGRARIFLYRDQDSTWRVEASLDVLKDQQVGPGEEMKVFRSPPIQESPVLDTMEAGYQWLRSSLEEDVKLAEQLLQEGLDADREANSRLEEFKKGHPPTLWERLG